MGEVESELRSNYAISYENSDIMEAKENVVVVNKKGETLNTEHLIWEKKTEKDSYRGVCEDYYRR